MATEFFCPKCNSPNPKDTVFCGKCGTRILNESAKAQAEDPLIGTFVGDRFLVHEKLGEGGMGVVYRAEQTAIKREVALKVLHTNLTQDESLFARFQNEAAACSRLNHPNTITIYDFGKTTLNSLYIAMEFIRGISLDDTIREGGAMDVTRACHIGNQICGSLQDAHNNSIVHRDLKPENVMLCERAGETDVVKVLDFGIAKIMEDESQDQRKALTKTGMVFGTPQYMSPEQIRGEKVDHRTDIYSLGVMMYQMLTGALPFNAETPMGLLTKHLLETPAPLEPQGVPAKVAAVVMAALEKEASARPQSMRELGQKLVQAAGLGSAGTIRQPAASPSAKTLPQTAISASASKAKSAPKSKAAPDAAKKPFPLVPVVIVALVLAGGGAAAWYFTAGPGAEPPSHPTTAVANMVPPQIPAGVPQVPASLPTAPPPALPTPPPVAATPTVPATPLPNTPEVVTPPSTPKSNDSGKKTTKKPKTPEASPSKTPSDTTPDKKPEDTPPGGTPPTEDVACKYNAPNDATGKAVLSSLKRQEKALKLCASGGKVDAAFQFEVAAKAGTVSNVSAIGGKANNCVQGRFEGGKFKAQDAAGKGLLTVTMTTSGKVVDSCDVKLRMLPVKGLSDLKGISGKLKGGDSK